MLLTVDNNLILFYATHISTEDFNFNEALRVLEKQVLKLISATGEGHYFSFGLANIDTIIKMLEFRKHFQYCSSVN